MARLGDVCKFQSGGTPSKKEPTYFNGNIPWITTVALNGNVIGADDAVDWITETAIAESAAKIVPANSIMVGTRVGIGKVAVNSIPMSTSQDIISLVEIDETLWNKLYLCQFISSKSNFLNSQARGATIKGIKIDVLAELKVPDVSLIEQTQITTALNKVDNLITFRKQQLDKLDELVKARFVEMFGTIPTHQYITMNSICSIITDGTHQPPKFVSEGIPFLFVSNVVANKITYDTEKFISEETYQALIKRTPIEIGDILLSTVGSYGHPAIVKTKQKFCFQRHIAYLKPRKEIVNSYYLYGAFLSTDLQSQIEEKVKGVAQKTLNLSEIRTLKLPLPLMEQQQQFADFIGGVEATRLTIQQGLDKLEVMKKALMQEYFG